MCAWTILGGGNADDDEALARHLKMVQENLGTSDRDIQQVEARLAAASKEVAQAEKALQQQQYNLGQLRAEHKVRALVPPLRERERDCVCVYVYRIRSVDWSVCGFSGW